MVFWSDIYVWKWCVLFFMTPYTTVKNVLDCNEATERKHLDSPTSPSSCYVSPSLYFVIFPFTCITILFTGMLIVILFVSNKVFCLVDTGGRGTEVCMTVDRKEKALSIIIHTTYGTFFCGHFIGVWIFNFIVWLLVFYNSWIWRNWPLWIK